MRCLILILDFLYRVDVTGRRPLGGVFVSVCCLAGAMQTRLAHRFEAAK